jgi:hypothetical protein
MIEVADFFYLVESVFTLLIWDLCRSVLYHPHPPPGPLVGLNKKRNRHEYYKCSDFEVSETVSNKHENRVDVFA